MGEWEVSALKTEKKIYLKRTTTTNQRPIHTQNDKEVENKQYTYPTHGKRKRDCNEQYKHHVVLATGTDLYLFPQWARLATAVRVVLADLTHTL